MLHEGVWLGERERRGRKCVCEEREYDGGMEGWREQHRTTWGGVCERERERDERLGVT